MTINVQRPKGGYPLVIVKDDRDTVPLVGFGDLHMGAPTFDGKAAEKTRHWIVENKALWIGMGDYIDNGTKNGPGASWVDSAMRPDEQIYWCIDFLKPIAEQCIGMVAGNHEQRTYKDTGSDVANFIAYSLGIPYMGFELYAKLSKTKENTFTIYANHSTTAPKTMGLAMNAIDRDWRWAHFDIMAKAHDHSMGFDRIPYVEIDRTAGMVRERISYALLTGHYLCKPNSYNAKAARAPKPVGTVALWLDLKSRSRTVDPEYIV